MSAGPFYYQIEQAEGQLDALRADYLRRWGWSQTCNTPGSFWLWKRDFGPEDRKRRRRWRQRKPSAMFGKPSEPLAYGVITATTDLAIQMTVRHLDAQSEIEADDD